MRHPLAAVLGLLVSGSALAVVPSPALADHAADHTAAPDRVTLVGSLQSELGCADDWAPACEATRLDAVPGTTSYETDVEVPAGSYAFKVALGGGWEESYGADGGAADVPLVLRHDATLTFSYDHASHRVAVAPAEQPTDAVTDADEAMAGTSLRTPLTRERFYFVMADRFANGDPTNDTGGLAGGRLETGLDPTHKGFFHGGDIAGLADKLDYIEGMGTTAIWLTPSFKNRPVQGSGDQASAGYHGYWVTDFTRIDPHFGTNAELEAFIDRAHERGIKVFFDIITNHTADVIDYAEDGANTYVSKEASPYRDAAGQEFDDRAYAGGETFPELDAASSFPYTPVLRSEEDATVKVPAWLNDPTNYHNRGDSTFAGESSTYGDFVGLDDLFTEQPDVVDGMVDIYEKWVDFGIDGFRIDTVKHVNMEFWQEFAPAMRAEARRVGNDDFFAFGEVYDSNPAYLSTFSTEGRMDATLDFGFQGAGTGFAKGGATTRLRDFYAADDHYTDTDSNAYSTPTFLGNHDMGRIGTFLAGSGDVLERDRLAHALMYLTRGQPVVYYGDEQGFTGDGGDQDARQDMFPSRVATYNDDDLIGTDATTAGANFDTGHPLYTSIRDLARLRTRYPALADGAQLHRYASDSAGVFAVSRIDAEEDREHLVALNNATTAKTVTFGTEMRRGTFKQVWPASRTSLRSDAEGRVTVTVPPLSAVVWRAAGTLAERDDAPAVHFEKPSAGGVVGGRSPVTVAVPDGGFNQVTLAWRPVGGGGVDPARHRRQRAVPRLPRRHLAGEGHAGRVPRRAARQLGQPVGDLDVRHGRRPRHRAAAGRRWRHRAGDPADRGVGARQPQHRDGLPGGLDARLRAGADVAGRGRPGVAQDRLAAGRQLRLQGRHRRLLGRELRRRRGAGRCRHPAGPRRRPGRDVLLRPRLPLDHQRRRGADRHPRRQHAVRARVCERLVARLHARLAQGPRRRRHLHLRHHRPAGRQL